MINIDEWSRKEFYLHFVEDVVCTYSVTVNLDISNLKRHKLYPAMLWLLTDTVNEYEEFRTHLSEAGIGIFDAMTPSYTIFNKNNKNFSSIWTEFSPDYPVFLQRYLDDTQAYQTSKLFSPKPEKPENCFDVSMVPWVTFTALNINVYDAGKYLLPIFTMGKIFKQEGKTLLPLAIQVHHAVCDGYHVACFVDTLQEKINAFQRHVF